VQEEAALKRMAYFDTLTGLPNRVQLLERLEDAIITAREHRRALGLLRQEVGHIRDIAINLGYRIGEIPKRVRGIYVLYQEDGASIAIRAWLTSQRSWASPRPARFTARSKNGLVPRPANTG